MVPEPDNGSLALDLRAFIRQTVEGLREGAAPIVATLMAKHSSTRHSRPPFQEAFIAQRRQALRKLLERGRERGEVAPTADLELLVDIGFGAIWYRVLNRTRRSADVLPINS
jgi:hypothetical protein